MGVWRKKIEDYAEMERILAETPGISAREVARQLGVDVSTVTRSLPGMEEAGFLLAEDDKGRLWPFGRRQ